MRIQAHSTPATVRHGVNRKSLSSTAALRMNSRKALNLRKSVREGTFLYNKQYLGAHWRIP